MAISLQLNASGSEPRQTMGLRANLRAFTLIEMLIVLLVFGLTTTLLFQMLSQTVRMQRTAGIEIADSQQGAMQSDWLRQLINGLQPDYQNGKNVFKGTGRLVAGLSNNPLTVDYGAPIPFTLELAYDRDNDLTRLFYGGTADGAVLMYWPHDIGRFVYVDAAGDIHDSWPPPLNLWPQLPQAVRLEFEQDSIPHVIVATPDGPLEPPPRVRDPFSGTVMP
jgi:prepilin-type N-terminal cleavage/methylation domain-containing protein